MIAARRVRALCCGLMMVLTGCASDPAVPGATRADENLRGDIRRIINILESTSEPRCDAHRIVDTERAGLGQERWIVERCGQRVAYLVTFIVGRPGATDLSVRREDRDGNLP
jgi:hypothetical protein